MVDTFGKDIVDAYTNGNKVKEIYSNGVLVWPDSEYMTFDYIRGRFGVYDGGTLTYEAPRIELNIPFIQGGYILEAEVYVQTPYDTGNAYVIFNDYYNTDKGINGVRLSKQGPGTLYIQNMYTRSNAGGIVTNEGNHTVKQTIPSNNLNTKVYLDNTEVVNSDDSSKTSHTFSVSESIRIVLFNQIIQTGIGSNHLLHRFRIKNSNNTLLYDFVPAVRRSDGVAGLLDVIHNTFHTKADPVWNVQGVLDFLYGNY